MLIKANYDADSCSACCPCSKAWPLTRTHIQNSVYRITVRQQQNGWARRLSCGLGSSWGQLHGHLQYRGRETRSLKIPFWWQAMQASDQLRVKGFLGKKKGLSLLYLSLYEAHLCFLTDATDHWRGSLAWGACRDHALALCVNVIAHCHI